jgi:hypothetical protein
MPTSYVTTALDVPATTTPVAHSFLDRQRAWARSGLSSRHLSRRIFEVDRQDGVAARRLRRHIVRMINAGTFDLEGGNALLASLDLPLVQGNGTIAFRVEAGIRAPYDGPSEAIRYARTTIANELSRLRWTRFDGCPEGYGIDEPLRAGSPHDGRHGTVHTCLRLMVTVPAYEDKLLEQTARDLLLADLGRLYRVAPVTTTISRWDADVTTWDEYVNARVDDDACPGNWWDELGAGRAVDLTGYIDV